VAVRHGYGKIAGADALVFAYDTGDTRNSYKGRPTTNFFTNGHFAGGTGITQEGGSNATNEVIYFSNNPGGSDYVLRQSTGIQAEYQINLTTQLASSTTYVMSGWYGESSDYVGESRMFHARAYSSTGAHNVTGNGIGTVLKTVEIGGITWKYCYQTITTPSNYSNTFNWYVGYSSTSYTGVRYYTNIMMEQGTVPSQFVNGTRPSTQGLLDLTGNRTIDLSSTGFNSNAQPEFDGTNDYMDVGTGIISGTGDFTVEAVIQSGYQEVNGTILANYPAGNFQTFFSGRYIGLYLANSSAYLGSAPFTTVLPEFTTDPIHFLALREGTETRLYLNGVLKKTGSSSSTIGTTSTPFRVGANTSGTEDFLGQIFVVKAYSRALTADEVRNNYRHYKTRFDI
jgi:hypothetical protein